MPATALAECKPKRNNNSSGIHATPFAVRGPRTAGGVIETFACSEGKYGKGQLASFQDASGKRALHIGLARNCAIKCMPPGSPITAHMIEGLLNFLWDVLYFITGEGDWRLREHEKTVLEAVAKHLDFAARTQLQSLMQSKTFVQRSHKRVIRPRFYDASYVRLRPSVDFRKESGAYEIAIEVDNDRQLAHVEFYRGQIDNISFSKPTSFYRGKDVHAVCVRATDCDSTNAGLIDKAEHDR
jgi:hypothetical protein